MTYRRRFRFIASFLPTMVSEYTCHPTPQICSARQGRWSQAYGHSKDLGQLERQLSWEASSATGMSLTCSNCTFTHSQQEIEMLMRSQQNLMYQAFSVWHAKARVSTVVLSFWLQLKDISRRDRQFWRSSLMPSTPKRSFISNGGKLCQSLRRLENSGRNMTTWFCVRVFNPSQFFTGVDVYKQPEYSNDGRKPTGRSWC